MVVDHERHRAIWAHDGYGRDVFGLFFQTLTPEQRASIRVVAGDGACGSTHACMSGARTPNARPTGSTSSVGRAARPTTHENSRSLFFVLSRKNCGTAAHFRRLSRAVPHHPLRTVTP